MNLIDLHCDTLLKFMWEPGTNLRENNFSIDLAKMKKAGSLAQFFACFIFVKRFQGEDIWEQGYEHALRMIERGKKEFSDNADQIAIARNYEEIIKNKEAGKMSAILTIEEGGILNGKMSYLEELYRQGIRLITLTWNWENCLGYPNSREEAAMQMGLKPFGIEVVERMNELGMLVDVSHLSDGGFWDVLKYSKKPVVASHSNARALCNHPRNLTDEMIHALAENGGIAGVNFYPLFVHESNKITTEHLADHVEYMYRKGGEDFVAMGTDFDGFDDGESTITHIGQMDEVFDAIKKRGFTASQMDKFWSGNALRVIKESL
ncbi:MAG: dipeptidase [Tyzzerella sp.]|nr:dipeptidase [Tyzzerella sp.]